jgi:hypothetical protein
MHYSSDKVKLKNATIKRNQNMLAKYGSLGISNLHRQSAKKFYEAEKCKLEACEIVSEQCVTEFISQHYDTYTGKSGNRKLKRDNISIYKSLIQHTAKFSNYYPRKLPFVCMLDIAVNGFNLDSDMLCICKNKLTFDPQTQDWTKLYCMGCRLVGTTKPHFLHKYGEQQGDKKYLDTKVSGFIMRGKNETHILDSIEKEENIVIDRNFKVLNFFPDGYCAETNTIYEINEQHHRKTYYRKKDEKRRQILGKYLKCKFVIIWDDTMEKEIYEF